MGRYRVTTRAGIVIIQDVEQQLKMRVLSAESATLSGDTAVLEATLYLEQRSFIPQCSYFFELVDDACRPVHLDVDVDHFKAAVDFFFRSVLGTELYVKSIPRASSLCPQAVKQYQF